ncbi:TIGR02270 family protein [Nitrococcus mobilis]|uniref:TIGR02270 family protein n=1 Tax=Nitrococcus mobilis Nb-231 TaxID=314278 RepID=A4BPI7_9GAMM|nr:TIGR02270 family protein [Nitrococcus mobilis]EAR22488.1 hypothetical protein NB231_12149 [Nitrococcus mobilis Nb-231]
MDRPVIWHIVEQHGEEAAFLWLLRDAAVGAPHYSLVELASLDNRIEAHFDGLRIAGEAGWKTCAAALAQEEPGEVFCAAVLALEGGDRDKIQSVYNTVELAPETSRGLVAAFGWVNRAWWRGEVRDLLHSDELHWRRIGLAAAATHRVDPGAVLIESLQVQDVELRAMALRVAGVLGRVDFLPAIAAQVQSTDPEVRFQAACSAALLGDRGAAPREALTFVGMQQPRLADRALKVALRALPLNAALPWVNQLVRQPEDLRHAVLACGIIGEPGCVPWLLEQMSVPELARVAGESFAMITGVDLAYEDLEGEWPKGFEGGPTEDAEDENVTLDADEDLPWPEPRLIADWWSRSHGSFRSGQRYLVGKPIGVEHLEWVLRYGMQRQREAAALELKLLHPAEPLFETRAPGFRQQQMLG